ncbi:MAG TPA: carboxypeptidase regulatory-like domain-containing protein [Pyrinomonadaceae bacterium]
MRLALTLTKWLAPGAALFALACALLAPAEAGSPRAQDDVVRQRLEKADESSYSIVRGRVVYDDTSRPVRRARVMLITDGGGRSEHAALTDARGEFVIAGVSAGTYYAFVDVPGVMSPVGFISIDDLRASPGKPDLGEGRKFFDRIEVDGKQDVSVTVHARRGAALAGRVSYADGDPAVNVQLTLMRRTADGRVQKYLTGATIVSLSGLRTDDRGMFRLTGLPPGEYVIGVSEAVNHGGGSTATDMSEDLPSMFRGMFSPPLLMTFYPSTTSVKEAGVIKVDAGEERADVDITIPERDLRLVGGVVRSRLGGRPVSRARVTITRRDDPLAQSAPPVVHYEGYESGPNSTTTDTDGRWYFQEIPDGAYTIQVKPPEEFEEAPAVVGSNMNSNVSDANANNTNVITVTNVNTSEYRPPRRKRSYAPTSRNLDVSGDVSEMVVEVADGARVTGTVTVEGGPQPRWGHISLMRVGEGNAAPDGLGTGSASVEGGRFAVEGLAAGRFVFQPSIGGGSENGGAYLKSITWNGKDLLREPLELAEGVSVEGVRIVYANNAARLSVSIRAASGKRLPPDIFVSLVPVDLSAWSPHTRPIFCHAGEAGTCPIFAPPGEYRVLAMRSPSNPGVYEQEVRRRFPTAPRVSLREGETRTVEVDAPDN